MAQNPFVYIVGATCTGKTSLAIAASKMMGGAPIINGDSIQVFQGLDVGSAKPTAAEKRQAPHRLFDHVPPGRLYSVANYLNDVLREVNSENLSSVIFCGGSGFYIQALKKGLYPDVETSQEVKDKVWSAIDTNGFQTMFQWLKKKDPTYAEKIHPKDHYRIRRGLEILMSQEMTITELRAKMELEAVSPLPPHRPITIGLYWNREEQRAHVAKRTQAMLEQGWIEEVQELLKKGFREWPPLKSVGYREVLQYLDGEIPQAELPQRITIATMQLIKKQTTWFKKQQDVRWFHSQEKQQALDYLRERLIEAPG